jgi:hypothetical protein
VSGHPGQPKLALPVDEAADAWWLEEGWRRRGRRGLRAFYKVKPFIPRHVQLWLRRRAARRQRSRRFPSWPYEDVLLRRRAEALARALEAHGTDRLPVIAPWPEGHRFAYVLTHDVDTADGVRRIPELLEVERRHNAVSSYYFCGASYPVTERDLKAVRAAGCEVGVHGMEHDGRLFASRASFERNLPRIADQLAAWDAVGFRSPALHRWAPWMRELPVLYDSSYPHTDPFAPQPGGCCSVHPFFFGDVVELPVTLDQDFTLFELLGERTSRLWTDKSRWLIDRHGLVNVIVHPDYMTPERLERYEELVAFLAAQPGGWHALPRDVAAWWRTRAGLEALPEPGGGIRIAGPSAERAAVAWARPTDDGVAFEN